MFFFFLVFFAFFEGEGGGESAVQCSACREVVKGEGEGSGGEGKKGRWCNHIVSSFYLG